MVKAKLWLLATYRPVWICPLRNFGKRFLPQNKEDADVLATKDRQGSQEGILINVNPGLTNPLVGGLPLKYQILTGEPTRFIDHGVLIRGICVCPKRAGHPICSFLKGIHVCVHIYIYIICKHIHTYAQD